MRELLIGGLEVSLGQVVKVQVGVMYRLRTTEDVAMTLRMHVSLMDAGAFIGIYDIDDEITILTSFATIDEAERFLVEKFDATVPLAA